MENLHCNRIGNCESCPSYGREVFYYLQLIKGYHYQQYYFKQNEVIFFLSGRIRIEGLHIPGMIVAAGEMLAFPAGMEIDIEILEDVKCITYRWEELEFICEAQRGVMMETTGLPAFPWKTLDMNPVVLNFLDSVGLYLENGVFCRNLWKIKEQELLFLLNTYYSLAELAEFLAPILANLNRFKSFVRQNYYKVRTVEELAILGRYGIITFRRLFLQEFGEPAYRWMSRQKLEHISYDLIHREITISEIAYKYQFESLSQFSNYCKKHLGASPREIMKKRNVNDRLTSLENEV